MPFYFKCVILRLYCKNMKIRVILILIMTGLSFSAFAQIPEEEQKKQEKQFDEFIAKTVEKYEELLNLEDWQVFYMDSIYTHDMKEMTKEITELGSNNVTNPSLYYVIQDKWGEAIYNAMHKILDERQWAKYLKMGAAREKKDRDKRAQKNKEL